MHGLVVLHVSNNWKQFVDFVIVPFRYDHFVYRRALSGSGQSRKSKLKFHARLSICCRIYTSACLCVYSFMDACLFAYMSFTNIGSMKGYCDHVTQQLSRGHHRSQVIQQLSRDRHRSHVTQQQSRHPQITLTSGQVELYPSHITACDHTKKGGGSQWALNWSQSGLR